MGRIEKINQQVKREVGRIIQQELADPRVQRLVAVDCAGRLRDAEVDDLHLGFAADDPDEQV